MRGRSAAAALAGGALAAGLAHALPGAVGLGPLRVRLFPRLAGLGRPGHVALTFDDGPDPLSTPRFLDELDRLGWRATFFMLGDMARKAPSLAAEVARRGHEVAVHGDVHRSHLLRRPGEVAADLARATDTIAEATGRRPVWLRPPYGAVSAGTLKAARALSLRLVLWSGWGRDWRSAATPASVAAEVLADLRPGATILLHDSDCTSAPGCWHAALGALEELRRCRQDLDFGPLGDHFRPGPASQAEPGAG